MSVYKSSGVGVRGPKTSYQCLQSNLRRLQSRVPLHRVCETMAGTVLLHCMVFQVRNLPRTSRLSSMTKDT